MMFMISLYPSVLSAVLASVVLAFQQVYGRGVISRYVEQLICLTYIVAAYLSWVTTESQLCVYVTVLIALSASLLGLPRSLTTIVRSLGLGLALASFDCVLMLTRFPLGPGVNLKLLVCILWFVAASFGSSCYRGRLGIVSNAYLHTCVICNLSGLASSLRMNWFCNEFWIVIAALLVTKCLPIMGIRGFGTKPLI